MSKSSHYAMQLHDADFSFLQQSDGFISYIIKTAMSDFNDFIYHALSCSIVDLDGY